MLTSMHSKNILDDYVGFALPTQKQTQPLQGNTYPPTKLFGGLRENPKISASRLTPQCPSPGFSPIWEPERMVWLANALRSTGGAVGLAVNAL